MKLEPGIRSTYLNAVRSTVRLGDRGSFGAGFVVATGLLITNHHVASSSKLNVKFQDGKEAVARVIARQENQDLALLECDTSSYYPLTLSKSARLELGDVVFAIGHPLGIENAWSQGIVSGVDSFKDSLLQMDISLAPGNSGGPILNDRGGVVGVATMIASPGIGLAVRSESIEGLLERATKWRAA